MDANSQGAVELMWRIVALSTDKDEAILLTGA
jgi:hypothetical protein